MQTSLVAFGEREPGADYQDRPGSYALIFDQDNQLLTLATPSGVHLPGGGREDGERAQDNLLRELHEECGLVPDSVTPVTSAIQYVFAPGEGYFKKICDYFWVVVSSQPRQMQIDHAIEWRSVDNALRTLSHESHRYGLQKTLELISAR